MATTLFDNMPDERPSLWDSIKDSTLESFHAAGSMIGLYHPETQAEANMLKKRFMADVAMLVASAATGGVAGEALKGAETVGHLAKAILGGALTGAAGNAAFAGVQGQPVLPAAAMGAGMGALFGAPAGLMAKGATAATSELASKAAVPEVAAEVAPKPIVNPVGIHDMGVYNTHIPGAIPSLPPEPAVPIAEAFTNEQVRMGTVAEAVRQLHAPTQAQVDESPLLQIAYVTKRGKLMGTQDITDPRIARAAASGMTPPRTFTTHLTENPWFGEVPVPPASPRQMATIIRSGPGGTVSEKVAESEVRRIFREFVESSNNKAKDIETQGIKFSTRLPKTRSFRYIPGKGMLPEEAPPLPTPEAQTMATTHNIVDQMLQKLPDSERAQDVFSNIMDIYKRGILVSGVAVSKMGALGAEIAQKMSGVIDTASQLASEDVHMLNRLTRGLTKRELEHLGMVLHGAEVPETEAISTIANSLRDRMDRIAASAQEHGLQELVPSTDQIRPFAYRKNFFPMVYPDKVLRALRTPGPERDAIIAKIMGNSTVPVTKQEAEMQLERFLKMPPEIRFGHLQVARELSLPDFEKNINKVLPMYFTRAWRRIETARIFGAGDEAMIQPGGYLSKLAEQGYDPNIARETYLAFADRAPHGYGALIRATRSLNVVSLLSTAGLVQLGQQSNTIAYIGVKNYMRGLGALFTQEGKDWAAQTGSYMQDMLSSISPEGVSQHWMRIIGLTPLDKANRIIATLGGYFHAKELAEKYAASIGTSAETKFARLLTQIGLVPEEVAAAGGQLTNQQLRDAAQQVSHITQFRGSPLEMPIYKNNTALGQFAYLFKGFAIAQFRFVNQLVTEARVHGNWAPLLRYFAATGTLTAGIGHVARTLRGNNVPDHPGWAYLDAAASGGALGIGYDTMKAMASGPEFFANFLGGPTASDVYHLFGTDVPEAVRGNPKAVIAHVLSKTPIFGRRLAKYLTGD